MTPDDDTKTERLATRSTRVDIFKHWWKYSPYSISGNGGRFQPCGIFHSRRRDRCGQRYGGRPSSCLFRFWKVRPDAWGWPDITWPDGWIRISVFSACDKKDLLVMDIMGMTIKVDLPHLLQGWQRYTLASFNSVQHQRYHGPRWSVITSRRLPTELLGIQLYITR